MMSERARSFFRPYFADYQRLAFNDSICEKLDQFATLARTIQRRGAKMMFGGNGASAASAAHSALDFTKQGKVRSVTFHDAALVTAFANDYGYDHWLAKTIEHYGDDGDAVVLISVSGMSPSVVNAARHARERGMPVVGLSGRRPDNDLARLSDISLWVESDAYNQVENVHSIWLTATIDYLIGKAVYAVSDIVRAVPDPPQRLETVNG